MKDRGEVSGWIQAMDDKITSEGNNREGIVAIAKDWEEHAEIGKLLIERLQDLPAAAWPEDKEERQNLLEQAFSLLVTLQSGISTIETYYSDSGYWYL
jgi:hypothetical protein